MTEALAPQIVIAAIKANSDDPRVTHAVVFDSATLEQHGLKLERTEGRTACPAVNQAHYELVRVSAEEIHPAILDIYSHVHDSTESGSAVAVGCLTLTGPMIKERIREGVTNGEFSREQVNRSLLNKLKV